MTTGHPSAFEFNGVVRLTKIGVSFLVFTIVIGFAAINTGNNALYIALSFMLGCVLLSGIASKGGLKHLRIHFDSIGEAWAGRAAEGKLRIENRLEMIERVLGATRAKKFLLVNRVGISDGQLHQEAVELRLGQRIGSDVLDRILRSDDQKWIGKRKAPLLDADHSLAHRLEQRRL